MLPLRETRYLSGSERTQRELVSRLRRGEPIRYPVPLDDPSDLRVWYLFYDDFLIVPTENRAWPLRLEPKEWEPVVTEWDDWPETPR